MSALAIALLRGLGKRILAGVKWLLADPLRPPLVAALAALAWLLLVTLPGKDETIAKREATIVTRTAERDQERSAHRQTQENYRTAQQLARALEEQRLARVAAEQQEISDAVTEDYRRRVAAARAAADRLRQDLRAGAGAIGAPGSVAVPGTGSAAGGAAAPAGDRRLPLDPAELDWRLTATEQAIQLDELIKWVEAQAQVDTNR